MGAEHQACCARPRNDDLRVRRNRGDKADKAEKPIDGKMDLAKLENGAHNSNASTRSEEEPENPCDICFDNLFSGGAGEVIVLSGCEDIYHIDCVREHIAAQIDAADFPLKCPNHECRKELTQGDIKTCLTEEEYERFSKFEWKWTRDKIPGMKECPNPECNYYFESECSDSSKFDCPLCKQSYCLQCSAPYKGHENYTCEEFALMKPKYVTVRETNFLKRIFRKEKKVRVKGPVTAA